MTKSFLELFVVLSDYWIHLMKKKSYNYYLALRFRLHSCNKGTKL